MTIQSINYKITELYNQYKNDEFILSKLTNYINNDLPLLLINCKKQKKIREDRRELLIEAHNKFVKEFINKNIYFYSSTTEIFFKYDNNNYYVSKEDDIIYSILSSLSYRDNQEQVQYYEEKLLPWKFKIKTSIIKQLRDVSIFTSIPESITIQNVINLFYNTFFKIRNEVKYFLTILGDTILKKQNNNIYLISNTAKPILRLLESFAGNYFGHIPLQQQFRYKYHEHPYQDCRILNIKNVKFNSDTSDYNYEQFQKNIINIIVVSCYYSNRYDNSDEFLNNCQDENLSNRVLYLKNNNQNKIVNDFISSKIQISNDSTISSKNMLYLWKCYLEENNIPYIIYSSLLKTLLKNKLNFNTNDDLFYGYTSLGLPIVSNFIKFWESSIKEDYDEYFLEIDEICLLFKNWLGGKVLIEIKESTILNLIKHFYPDINIENNKYIFGIISCYSSKKDGIITFLNNYHNKENLTSYELYVEYTKKYNKKNNNLIANKSYFDLVITEYFKDGKFV